MNVSKKECYSLVQEIVCARDMFCRGPQCFFPTTVGHHLFKRDNMATAFDTRYVIGFCAHCHDWAHRHPQEFKDFIISMIGEGYYVGLRLSETVVKHSDFNAIREKLKKELNFVKKY